MNKRLNTNTATVPARTGGAADSIAVNTKAKTMPQIKILTFNCEGYSNTKANLITSTCQDENINVVLSKKPTNLQRHVDQPLTVSNWRTKSHTPNTEAPSLSETTLSWNARRPNFSTATLKLLHSTVTTYQLPPLTSHQKPHSPKFPHKSQEEMPNTNRRFQQPPPIMGIHR